MTIAAFPGGFFISQKIICLSLHRFSILNKNIFISVGWLLFFVTGSVAQKAHFSLTTDLDFQHSFKKGQRYWAVGQTVQGLFSFSKKDGMYAWFSYYSNGKFHNNLAATAKSDTTTPQQVSFTNTALMRYKHFSIGWRRYLKGSYDNEDSWNLYGYAGFGLMMGRIENSYSLSVDTSGYFIPVNNGKAAFKRLTLDLGLGWEFMLGSQIYFYNEARVEIPTTDYPSTYLFVNNNAPLMASINFGIRILFD